MSAFHNQTVTEANLNGRPLSRSAVAGWNGGNVGVTGRTRHASYEAADVPRYGVDMIADGFAVFAKTKGKPTDDTGG